ncbi:hypothetical protein VNI00_008873 [Paramarasmius palmivorus]|uniref:Glycoside hydrolase family 76 protein n=1 Tax=Paramarasmius palmivorus TaxID=297713 RepID=A0AAW0CRL2_9AGAR
MPPSSCFKLHGGTETLTLYILLLFFLVSRAAAQMVIPSSWTNTTVNITKEERIQIASAALDMVLSSGIPQSDVLADFFTQLAEFDIATNQTRYQDVVSDYFLSGPYAKDIKLVGLFTSFPNVVSVTDALSQLARSEDIRYYNLNGYMALKAYIAYQDPKYLEFAVRAWEFERNFVVSDTGVPPLYQIFSDNARATMDSYSKCGTSADIRGGLMAFPNADIITSDTARYLRICALLAEITQNSTYTQAAQQSANFILSRVYTDDSLFLWKVAMNAQTCQIVTDETKDPWNAGYAVEGLAVLSSIWANKTIQERHAKGFLFILMNSVLASTKYPPWHDGRGIVSLNISRTGDLNLVRGLSIARAFESESTDITAYLDSYLAVQYNAVTNLATVPGTDIYGSSWTGLPATQYSADDQVRAAQVLVTGINLAYEEKPPSITQKRTLPIAGIVGSVMGGLFVMTAMIVGSLYMVRRRRQRMPSDDIQPYPRGFVGEKTGSKKFMPSASHNSHSDDQTQTTVGSSLRPTTDSSSSVARRDITTAELVHMLNQRLQPERWREDEQPPGYCTSTISSMNN